jgi:sigma-E factor negative regulatory protein RseB
VSSAASRDVRLVALVCLALVGLSGAPAVAGPVTGGSGEAAARRLLERAAAASRSVRYAGTQYIAGWSPTASSSALVAVAHDPARGTLVTRPASAGPADDVAELVPADGGGGLESHLLDVLTRHYALRVAGSAQCVGRTADVVEARRPHARGDGAVAGRFWVDRESALVLRREVYDEAGRAVTSTAFLDLDVVSPADRPHDGPAPAEATVSHDDALQRMHSRGWQAPRELPGGFSLFDARLRDGDRRVHLSYSDGLSTMSLFAQRGEIGTGPDGLFSPRTMGGARVWTSSSIPQRVVWTGGGQVWTLVSDAPAAAVHAAVVALPHDPPPEDGLLARLGRGLKRMGGMLNPFG